MQEIAAQTPRNTVSQLQFQEQLQGKFALSAVELDDQTSQVRRWAEFIGAGEYVWNGEGKMIWGADQHCFGLARNYVGEFSHPIADQAVIDIFGNSGEDLPGKRRRRLLGEAEDHGSSVCRREQCGNVTQRAVDRPLIDVLDDEFGGRHFTQSRERGRDKRFNDPVTDFRRNRLSAGNGFERTQGAYPLANELIEPSLERLDSSVGIIEIESRLCPAQEQVAIGPKQAR